MNPARVRWSVYGRVSRRAEKRKRSESENERRDSAGNPMSQTRRPNVPTFEYLYTRAAHSRILIYRRAKYERTLSASVARDGMHSP